MFKRKFPCTPEFERGEKISITASSTTRGEDFGDFYDGEFEYLRTRQDDRKEFAKAAMQGLLSGVMGDAELHDSGEEWKNDITRASIQFADALLAELEKGRTP